MDVVGDQKVLWKEEQAAVSNVNWWLRLRLVRTTNNAADQN